jgi:glycosyltransferase involved in cell wall biosynthesis
MCGCNINDQQIYLNKLAWADQKCPISKWGVPLEKDVTLCITTFLRPDALKKLEQSIDKFYPQLKRVIVDTKGNVSWGRNFAIKQVITPYCVILDDDFVFTNETKLETLLNILKDDEELGGVGGLVNNDWFAFNFRAFRDKLHIRPTPQTENPVYCDLINQFVMFRTNVFQKYHWDEALPINEHYNFFYSLWRGEQWRIALTSDVNIAHVRPRPSTEYIKYRKRNFVKQAEKAIGLTFVKEK